LKPLFVEYAKKKHTHTQFVDHIWKSTQSEYVYQWIGALKI
jgi:hypothetical protein